MPTANQLHSAELTGQTLDAMADLTIPEDALRSLLKQALIEALEERRDLLQDVVADALEEIALAEAIREGRRGDMATRDDVFAALRSEA